jgi:HAD superfamily hydrolase (TIGR01509 family)
MFERDQYIRQFMGMPSSKWEEIIRRKLTAYLGKKPESDCFKKLNEFTAEKLKDDLVAVSGARAAIEQLSTSICVASSSAPAELEWKLDHTNLLDLFEPSLFSTKLVKNGKPAPDLFLFAAKKMNVHPTRCVVVEDSSNGVLAAKSAGMKVVGFTAGSHCPIDHGDSLRGDGADVIVNSYENLTDVLTKLMST